MPIFLVRTNDNHHFQTSFFSPKNKILSKSFGGLDFFAYICSVEGILHRHNWKRLASFQGVNLDNSLAYLG